MALRALVGRGRSPPEGERLERALRADPLWIRRQCARISLAATLWCQASTPTTKAAVAIPRALHMRPLDIW